MTIDKRTNAHNTRKGYQFIISAPFNFYTPNIWAPLDFTPKTDKK